MIATPLADVRQIVGGRPAELSARTVSRVTVDTRDVQPGDLFVAIVGERFDPHAMLGQIAHAAAAVVSRVPDDAPPDLPLIVVADTRRALGELGNHHRRSLAKTKVIAVAGSNGKTGTKRLIHAALSGSLKGSASPKSFNNDLGVPLTLLPVEPGDDYVIVEVGTNHPGEVARLSEIAEPDIGVITSIGEEHLEGLRDLDGVRAENASLLTGMRPDGLLVVNGDDAGLVARCNAYGGKKLRFGIGPRNNLFARRVETGFDGTRFDLNGGRARVELPLIGEHNATNALAAVAVARRLGVPDDVMLAGLAACEPPPMRMQPIHAGGVRLLHDAYNANPHSMRAALRTLAALPHDGRRVAILGDMLELGDASADYHREIGRLVEELKIDRLITIGPAAATLAAASVRAGLPSAEAWCFATSCEAAECVRNLIGHGDLVLLKGSRGVRLERYADAAVAAFGG